jgi:hypothetical protein
MVDEGAVIGVARHRNAAAIGKQIVIKGAYPRQIQLCFSRIDPAGSTGKIQNRTAL